MEINMHKIRLDNIKNKNEERVKNKIPVVLSQYQDYKPDELDIQDIYALSLNLLPPRYRQKYSIVLQEPLKDEDIIKAINKAIKTVFGNPKSKYQAKLDIQFSN